MGIKPQRRDFMLQQMGLQEWQLVKPESLKGVVNKPVSAEIALLLISDEELSFEEPLLQDILRAVNLESTQCLSLGFDFAVNLQLQNAPIFWFLTEDEQKISSILTQFSQKYLVWKTPSFANLRQMPQAKRQFWQQIQQKESVC